MALPEIRRSSAAQSTDPGAGMTSETIGQIVLVLISAAFFLAGVCISLARLWKPTNALRLTAKSFSYFGICFALAALIWRSFARGIWLPIEDNFETMASLAILLAGFTLYVQRARPIPGLDWFLIPVVIVLLICSALFGISPSNSGNPASVWELAHRTSSFAGMAAFGLAAAVGAMYLIASARLRRKAAVGSAGGASLERLENLTQWAVSFGFALLTVGIITGLAKIMHSGSNTRLGPHWMTSPKVILAFSVWLVYAVALHTPITPAVRGRKSAMLSIVGFVLMVATIISVLLLPPGR
jgi:ABC-type transport system involved in cytochrome c biogenesis permease subunit